jgi:hypothetical protein
MLVPWWCTEPPLMASLVQKHSRALSQRCCGGLAHLKLAGVPCCCRAISYRSGLWSGVNLFGRWGTSRVVPEHLPDGTQQGHATRLRIMPIQAVTEPLVGNLRVKFGTANGPTAHQPTGTTLSIPRYTGARKHRVVPFIVEFALRPGGCRCMCTDVCMYIHVHDHSCCIALGASRMCDDASQKILL